MPAFRFQFTDARGQILEGTLQAASPGEAEAELRHRGYPNVRLVGVPQTPAPPVAPSPRTSSAVQAPPVVAPTPPSTAAKPSSPPSTGIVRTRKGTDKQRFFLFSQFSKLLNAGINPARAFDEVAKTTPYEHYKPSFRHFSEDTTNGRPLSKTMERYPDLYPDHVVGMVRAGEVGGFLPEAFMELSRHAEEAHKFKRYHWFIWLLIPNAVAAIPLMMAVMDALVEGYKRSTEESGFSMFLRVLVEKIVWPYGPATLLIAAILLALRAWLGTLRMRRLRHRMGLRMPIYGKRSRNESISIFTWTLGRLSKAAVPPSSAWALALVSVPNLAMQERLAEAGRKMHTGSKLSEAVFGSGLFPEEYAPVLSTGEMVGDVAGALDQLEKASRTEYEAATGRARWGSARIAGVFLCVTAGLLLGILYYGWYVRFYGAVLDDYKWSEESP